MKIFYIKEYPKNIIFYKIQIKSFSKLNSKTIKNLNSSTINRYFAFYDKKIKFKFKPTINKLTSEIFSKDLEYIKCTGVHINTGVILFDNLKTNKLVIESKIENHKIFNLIKNHFL